MIGKFIIAAYMAISGSDNVHIWTSSYNDFDSCTYQKTAYFDEFFQFIETEYYLMPRKIECIEIDSQINEYLENLQFIRDSKNLLGA